MAKEYNAEFKTRQFGESRRLENQHPKWRQIWASIPTPYMDGWNGIGKSRYCRFLAVGS